MNEQTPDNQPAFPIKPYPELVGDFSDDFRAWGGINPLGITKEEYFASAALQGLLSGRKSGIYEITPGDIMEYVKTARMLAGEMLRQS